MDNYDLIYKRFLLKKNCNDYIPRNDTIIVTCNLLTLDEHPYLWGAERFSYNICKFLSKEYMIHLFQQPNEIIHYDNVIVHSGIYVLFDVSYMRQICRLISEIKPKYIFCNAANGQQALFWTIISKMSKSKIIMFFHNEPDYIKNTFKHNKENLFTNTTLNKKDYIYNSILSNASKLFFLLESYVDNSYQYKSFILPNCVYLHNDSHGNHNHVLYVGRINKNIKRTHFLLNIVNKTSYVYDIVGKSYAYDGYIDMSKYNYNNVSFYGHQDDVERFYLNAKVLVITSIKEGFPTVILEAFSYGVPVIAYNDCKVMKEIIINNYNGILVNDETSLINALNYIYNNYNEYQQMSINCLEFVKKYDIYEIMKKLINNLKAVEI